MDCRDANFNNPYGVALSAIGLQVDRSVFLAGSFRATGSGHPGAARLYGSKIGGSLICSGGKFINQTGPAFDGERMQVAMSANFSNTEVRGNSTDGSMRLYGTQIGGDLDCGGGNFISMGGPALLADGLKVDGSVFLRNHFCASADSEKVTVRLVNARIGGDLDCADGKFTNQSGPALHADAVHVSGSVVLRDNFRAVGRHDKSGAVRLVSAQVGSALDFRKGKVCNTEGVDLDFSSTSVDTLRLPADTFCGTAEKDADSSIGNGPIALDGFTYRALS